MLEELVRLVEGGGRVPTDPWLRVIRPASTGTHAVLAFPGSCVVVTDLPREWVEQQVTEVDLSLPLNPPFLRALEERLSRRVNNVDVVLLAGPLEGEPEIGLTPAPKLDHPRVRRALRYRDEVKIFTADGGVVLIGRGLGGRWEVGVEVDEAARGKGLGRALAKAARHLVPEGRPIWAQIAPGNAFSVRAFLSAGYSPVGAEALLVS